MYLKRRLEHRLALLRMPRQVLASRTGLSLDAIERLLGDPENAPYTHVRRVTRALGLDLAGSRRYTANELVRREARKKARYLVKLVQGTSALEAQALDGEGLRELRGIAYRDLLANRQKIWS